MLLLKDISLHCFTVSTDSSYFYNYVLEILALLE